MLVELRKSFTKYGPNKRRSCNWVVSHLRITDFYAKQTASPPFPSPTFTTTTVAWKGINQSWISPYFVYLFIHGARTRTYTCIERLGYFWRDLNINHSQLNSMLYYSNTRSTSLKLIYIKVTKNKKSSILHFFSFMH